MADRHARGGSIFPGIRGNVAADHAATSAIRTGTRKTRRRAECTPTRSDRLLAADERDRAIQNRRSAEEELFCSRENTSDAASSTRGVFANSADILLTATMLSRVVQDMPGSPRTEKHRSALAFVPSETRRKNHPQSRPAWVPTYASLLPIEHAPVTISGAPRQIPSGLKSFSRQAQEATHPPCPEASKYQPERFRRLPPDANLY